MAKSQKRGGDVTRRPGYTTAVELLTQKAGYVWLVTEFRSTANSLVRPGSMLTCTHVFTLARWHAGMLLLLDLASSW